MRIHIGACKCRRRNRHQSKQLLPPSDVMRTALAHALAWPDRVESGVAPLDLLAVGQLNFEAPDRQTFRCLDLAYQALAAGGTAPTTLNAANEVAVAAFLEGTLPFLAIAELIEATLEFLPATPAGDLEALVYADLTARREAQRIMRSTSRQRPRGRPKLARGFDW